MKRLWPTSTTTTTEPTAEEWQNIGKECEACWTQAREPRVVRTLEYDGTFASLFNIYQTHKHSPFLKLREVSTRVYVCHLRALEQTIGTVRLADVSFETLIDWQHEFAVGGHPTRASKMLTLVKRIIEFGSLVVPDETDLNKLLTTFQRMRNKGLFITPVNQRESYLTVDQVHAHIAEAHRMGWHSIAMAQAFQFDCALRRKDVIGEWISLNAPGLSDISYGRQKWLMGIRWEEISDALVLRHRLSKSVKGAAAVAEPPDPRKLEEYDLNYCPLVMAEISQLEQRPQGGPVIVCESTGRPWSDRHFREVWRDIARAVGIPEEVQNRDSRAGAATEADLAGAPRDKIQTTLAHSRSQTTLIYLRERMKIRAQINQLRSAKRDKN